MSDEKEPLLRVEFRRDSLNLTDTPLQFIMYELSEIVTRIPDECKIEANMASKLTVTIYAE